MKYIVGRDDFLLKNEIDCFIEFGASVLKGMNKKICDKPTYSITNLNSLNETLEALR